MCANIFKRVEEKYLLTDEQYKKLFDNINEYIEKDKYFETTICNIYFDNNEDELIYTSMDKPIYKHKLRLRSYGIPKIDEDVFLEIKFKFKKALFCFQCSIFFYNIFLIILSYWNDNFYYLLR